MLQIEEPSKWIADKWSNISRVVKVAFFAALIIGICTHSYIFMRQNINEDSLGNYYSLYNLYSSGRWILGYATGLTSNYTLPSVIGIACILYLAIASALTVSILDIAKRFTAIIIAGLLVTFPTLAYGFGYTYMAEAYAMVLLLTALGVYFTKGYKLGFILGGCILAVSLGIYQGYLGYGIVLIIIIIILKALNNKVKINELMMDIARYLGFGIIGIAGYFISLNVYLQIIGGSLSTYKGASDMGKIPLELIPSLIKKAYTRFFEYFSGGYFYTSDLMKSLYILVGILLIISLITIIYNNKIYKDKLKLVIIFIFIGIMPLGVNIVDIVAPTTKSGNLTIYPMVLVIMLPVIFIENIKYKNNSKFNLYQWLTVLTLTIISFNYYIIDNIYYLKLETYTQRTINFANRLVSRIEESIEDKAIDKIAIIGDFPSSNYPKSSMMFREIQNDQGLWGQYIGLNGNNDIKNTYKFTKIMDIHLGFGMKQVTGEELEAIKLDPEYLKMSVWPHKESVKVIGDTVVIKLNQTLEVQIENIGDKAYRFTEIGLENDIKDYQYAWYIFKDNERIDVKWYTEESFLEYKFEEPGEYKVLVFINDANGVSVGTQYSSEIEIK